MGAVLTHFGYAAPCSKASLDPMSSGIVHHCAMWARPQLPSGFYSPGQCLS